MPRMNALLGSMLLCACSAQAPAHDIQPIAPPFAGLGDLQIVDRTSGETLPVYWSGGQRWVAGVPGHAYAVRLQNRTNGRILAVLSVDGVNAVTGESAGWEQRGYVLSAWQSAEILGWRKSQSNVADFVFASLEDSYAARTGRPDNVGVIGVALFREAAKAAPPISVQPRAGLGSADAAKAAPGALAQAPSAASQTAPTPGESGALRKSAPLGTAHGPNEESFASTTTFDRAQPRPDLLISIRYDRRERLVAMGIIPQERQPSPFPESASFGFVPDPPPRSW